MIPKPLQFLLLAPLAFGPMAPRFVATAEGVGCHYVDTAQRQRWDAVRKAREKDGIAATCGGAATEKG